MIDVPHKQQGAATRIWIAAGVALVLWQIGRRKPIFWAISARSVPVQLVIAAVLAYCHGQLLSLTIRFLMAKWIYLVGLGYGTLNFLGVEHVGLDVLLYIVAWAATAALHTQTARKNEELHTAELKQKLATAHLYALHMQMEPHFLFNTLNAITTLVELGRQQQAVHMLRNLSALLKSTLSQASSAKLSLASKLRLVESYLAIEQVRFADRLRIKISVDPNALEGLVPSFLLQPIVENCIRHGISHMQEAGVIQTSIKKDGDTLCFAVRDNGPGQNDVKKRGGHGIGLRNTAQRLAQMYPSRHHIAWGNAAAGSFEVCITIPFEKGQA